jgi:hypothetical protein
VSHFVFAPLTAPADEAAVERLRDESRDAGINPAEVNQGILLAVEAIGALIFTALIVFVGLGRPSFSGLSGVVYLLFFVIAGACLASLLAVAVPNTIFRIRRQWPDYSRLRSFADANGLTYTASEEGSDLEGAIFHMRGAQTPRAGNVFWSARGMGFEVVGHYHYTRDKSEVHWGYIAIDLGRPLPHLVLRGSRRRRTHRNFLIGYAKSPVIPLEQDEARNFVLYGRPEEAPNAHGVFTDALLGRLRQLGRGIDAETLESHLFVYSSKPFALTRPKVIQQLFEVIDVVLEPRA